MLLDFEVILYFLRFPGVLYLAFLWYRTCTIHLNKFEQVRVDID